MKNHTFSKLKRISIVSALLGTCHYFRVSISYTRHCDVHRTAVAAAADHRTGRFDSCAIQYQKTAKAPANGGQHCRHAVALLAALRLALFSNTAILV